MESARDIERQRQGRRDRETDTERERERERDQKIDKRAGGGKRRGTETGRLQRGASFMLLLFFFLGESGA